MGVPCFSKMKFTLRVSVAVCTICMVLSANAPQCQSESGTCELCGHQTAFIGYRLCSTYFRYQCNGTQPPDQCTTMSVSGKHRMVSADRVTISASREGNVSLVTVFLKEMKPTDEGNWKCGPKGFKSAQASIFVLEVPKPKISIIDQAKIGGFTQRFSCTASSRYPSYVKATVDFRLIHDGKIVGRPVYPAQPNGNNTIIQGFLSENKPGTYWCRVEIQSGTLSSCKGITHQDSTNKISIPLKHPTPSPKPMRTEKQTMTYEIAASPTPMATSSTAMSTSPTAHRPMKDEIEEKDPLHVALAPGIIGSLGMITIAIVLSCKAYRVYTHRTMKKGVSATEAPGMYEPTLSLSDKSDSSSFNETPPFHPPRLVRVHQASKDDTTISPFVVLPATSHSSPTDLSKLAGEQGHTGAPYTYPQATASHSRVQQHSPNEGQAEDGSFSTQV